MQLKSQAYTQVPEQVSQILGPRQLRARLLIGNTAFYDAIREGRLPAPSFYLGTKSPRWYWSEVAAYIEARRVGNRKRERVSV